MRPTEDPVAAPVLHGMSPEDERRNIQALLVGASLELSSRDPVEINACADLLEPGTAVYISMPPGQTYHGIVALATRLKRAGLRPVPHVAARRIASRDALDEYLARAAGEAGVDSALVIAGDSDRASGPFESSFRGLRACPGCSDSRCCAGSGTRSAPSRRDRRRLRAFWWRPARRSL